MDELSAEAPDGSDRSAEAADEARAPEPPTPPVPEPAVPEPAADADRPASEIREHYHSQFAGISNIWPTSVCGH